MTKKLIFCTKIIFILVLFSTTSFSQLTITTNTPKAQYATGDVAEFIITSNVSGIATWTLKYDPIAPIINSGTINLTAGIPYTLTHLEASPGVVLCNITQGGITESAAAVFSPYDIAPFETIPADLDIFWENKKQDLSTVPINPVVTIYDSTTYSKTYRIMLDNIDGRKVYGYLSVPISTGPYPAVIILPPYGIVPNITVPEIGLAERAGVLAFSVSIHNVLPDTQDPNAYEPDNYADKNENYYKYGLLGAIRAIDYLFTRSDFDGQNVGVTGVSQGGGLSICLAGIDDRVNLLMYSVPVLCQNTGLVYGKAGGFPNYINRSRLDHNRQSHEDSTIVAVRYYDGMFLAKNCNYPVMGTVSYEDQITPLATGLTAYNQLPNVAPRIMIHSVDLGHTNPPEFFQGRYDFIHRYFPSSVATTPWPFNNNSGYHIDAGQDTTIHIDSTLSLNGLIELNTTSNPNYEVKWSVIDSSGIVTFSNTNSYNNTVTFDTEGIYTLQFMGTDTSLLTNDNRFFTLMDYIKITVEGCVTTVLYYPDNDNDGFGDYNENPTPVCLGDTPPTGYVENNTDCDDMNGNDVNLVIDDTPIVDGTYQANMSINSEGTIPSSSNMVVFSAGETIYLKSGFVAEAGCDFIAIIDSCSAAPNNLIQEDFDEVEISKKQILDNKIVLLENKQYTIYPNPAVDNIFVNSNNQQTQDYIIFDLLGKTSLIGKINFGKNEISINSLKSGIYFLKINNEIEKFLIHRN